MLQDKGIYIIHAPTVVMVLYHLNHRLYLNQNTPGVKKVVAKNQKKARIKKMWNQIGRLRPPAVDEINFFDNHDKAAKH